MTDEDLSRFQHPRFARLYPEVNVAADRRGGADHRRRLLAGLSGTVLELGAGHGPNFAHYPATVTRVLAVEPDDTLRALAQQAATEAPVPVEVVAGHADALPADDASFGNVVAALVLCSVPELDHALAEIRRILRPGGQFRYYEHVRNNGFKGVLQDVVRPLWGILAAGCHPNRRTGEAIRAAGFVVDEEDRFSWRTSGGTPAVDHLIGRAH